MVVNSSGDYVTVRLNAAYIVNHEDNVINISVNKLNIIDIHAVLWPAFERNLHNQISSGDSVQSTTFCGNQVVDTTFWFHDPL